MRWIIVVLIILMGVSCTLSGDVHIETIDSWRLVSPNMDTGFSTTVRPGKDDEDEEHK